MSEWYNEYLESEHWQAVREKRLAAASNTCERCGWRTIGLEVHHLTYERIWHESPEDLEVLCGWCHGAEHGIQRHTTWAKWKTRTIDRMMPPWWWVDDHIDEELAAWDDLAEAAGL